ncbi:MAG TPA: AMP-binding protein, partial [Candidatus Dormibacteraeota bacterium]|nr:AMP-binding protein [Candidatus Dormibacteraeota bacterium]
MTPYEPISYLETNASRRPRGVAIWEGGREIDFAALLANVQDLRKLMASRGVRAGDVVGVRLPNIWQYVALEIAIPDIGATILPLPLSLGEHEVRWVMEKTHPRLVITDPPDVASAQSLPAVRRVGPDPDRIVEIALTSGTTGMPKLASLNARLKQVTFEGFTDRLGITERDR